MTPTEDQALPGMPVPAEPREPPYDELSQLAIQLRCEHCKAITGQWCKTRSGHYAGHLHAARMLVVQSIFWLGFEHGHVAGVEQRVLREADERTCENCGNDDASYVVCSDCMVSIPEAAS
jgi:hypothetical protein